MYVGHFQVGQLDMFEKDSERLSYILVVLYNECELYKFLRALSRSKHSKKDAHTFLSFSDNRAYVVCCLNVKLKPMKTSKEQKRE